LEFSASFSISAISAASAASAVSPVSPVSGCFASPGCSCLQ